MVIASWRDRGLRRRRAVDHLFTVVDDAGRDDDDRHRGRPGDGARVGNGNGGVHLDELGEFDQPLYVTQPPSGDDHLYVVEQCGTIQRITPDGGAPSVFLDISDQVTCGGEQGLLSVAFAPDYAKSGLLYVDFTGTDQDQHVFEYTRSKSDPATADPSTGRELVHIADFAPNHNGGLLMFGPDGELYLGMGDGGGAGDPERTAQDPVEPARQAAATRPRQGELRGCSPSG